MKLLEDYKQWLENYAEHVSFETFISDYNVRDLLETALEYKVKADK
jgi:hypothetical protein